MPDSTRNRAIRGQDVVLSIQYTDANGDPIAAASLPLIQILDSNDTSIVDPTFSGMIAVPDEVGLYEYIYDVDVIALEGLWTDLWTATVDGSEITSEFKFLVADEINTDPGTVQIGDDVDFDFSDAEVLGLNILLKFLKARLRSDGKKPLRDENGAIIRDGYGEIVYEVCNVFDDEVLVCYLLSALMEFNGVPFFTTYGFSDQIIFTTFSQFIVEGAYIIAIASQALIEKGRDFTISDGGISYQPPQLGDFLQSHFGTWMTSYRERLKFVKNSIRPGPGGVATFSSMTSAAPQIARLRHLRSRRLI